PLFPYTTLFRSLDRLEEGPGPGRGPVVDGLDQAIEPRPRRGIEREPLRATDGGDGVAIARLLDPATGEVEERPGVVRRQDLEPSDRRADREPAEHVGGVLVG